VRKIAAGLFISLDGVVEFPDKWGFKYINADISGAIAAGIAYADAVLIGPTTYRTFAGMWPQQPDDVPMARFLNHSQKYVISRSPEKVGKLEWGPAELLKGELASALRYVKGKPGKNIQVPGSPKLVRSLLHHGLLDELSLTICPEIVGAGLRLFDEAADQRTLTLDWARVHSNGAISVTYRPSRSSDAATAAPLSFPDAAATRK